MKKILILSSLCVFCVMSAEARSVGMGNGTALCSSDAVQKTCEGQSDFQCSELGTVNLGGGQQGVCCSYTCGESSGVYCVQSVSSAQSSSKLPTIGEKVNKLNKVRK